MADKKNAQVEGASVQAIKQPVTQTVATGVVPGKCPTCGRDKVNS